MFEASVPDDFFEDEDVESLVVLESCNISDAFEEDNECGDEDLRISQGLTQESALERVHEVLEAIKMNARKEDINLFYTPTLYYLVY